MKFEKKMWVFFVLFAIFSIAIHASEIDGEINGENQRGLDLVEESNEKPRLFGSVITDPKRFDDQDIEVWGHLVYDYEYFLYESKQSSEDFFPNTYLVLDFRLLSKEINDAGEDEIVLGAALAELRGSNVKVCGRVEFKESIEGSITFAVKSIRRWPSRSLAVSGDFSNFYSEEEIELKKILKKLKLSDEILNP